VSLIRRVAGHAARGVAGDPTWPEKCAEILRRRAAGETLKAIGASMGLGKERVRQIERLCKHAPECPDCEWQDEGGLWRTGVCYNCKGGMEQGWQETADEYVNRMAGEDCGNCQGTGSPICCRCEGTHVDLNP